MGMTIAINNQKGGVAKTTTCLSLGASLAEMGHIVLLIDLDPQAHLTLSFDIKPKNLRRTVCDAFLANSSLVSVSRESAIFGLDIVPASYDLALIDKLIHGKKGYEFYLKHILAAMGEDYYDFVIIDCPPAYNALTLNALTAADLLIIPVQCEYYAARSLKRIVRFAKWVQAKTNSGLTYQMLVTMYDRRNKICQLIFDQMRQELSHILYKTIIEVDTKLKESPAFGQPITHYAPNTRGAQQYRALAKELVNHG